MQQTSKPPMDDVKNQKYCGGGEETFGNEHISTMPSNHFHSAQFKPYIRDLNGMTST